MIEKTSCPFCGHKNIEAFWMGHGGVSVYCYECEAEGPPRHTEAEAIAAWNRRAPASQAQRVPLSDDDVGLWIVRTLGAASKQGKYSAISNCVPLGDELVPFFLEFARDHGITQENQG